LYFVKKFDDRVPKLNLLNEKGLSTELVKTLHAKLLAKANSLIGREMVYELCQLVQEFLYDHNKPPTKSFYEQRLESQLFMEKKECENEMGDEKKKKDEKLV
jgi:eukaryotic translation initiation factor 2-alpha kinase 4